MCPLAARCSSRKVVRVRCVHGDATAPAAAWSGVPRNSLFTCTVQRSSAAAFARRRHARAAAPSLALVFHFTTALPAPLPSMLPTLRGGGGGRGRPASGAPAGFATGVAASVLCALLVWVLAPRAPADQLRCPAGGAEGGGDAAAVAAAAEALAGRPRVVAVVGVQTGFTTDHSNPKYNYEARRRALRAAWFPPTQEALDRSGGGGRRASSAWLACTSAHTCTPRAPTPPPPPPPLSLERERGLVVRFVAGHSPDPAADAALAAEAAAHGGFLRLELREGYASLPVKTVAFLSEAVRRYDAQYILKASG